MEKKNFVFTTADKKDLINIINIVNILKENGEENISEIKNNVRDDYYVFYNGYAFIVSIGKYRYVYKDNNSVAAILFRLKKAVKEKENLNIKYYLNNMPYESRDYDYYDENSSYINELFKC